MYVHAPAPGGEAEDSQSPTHTPDIEDFLMHDVRCMHREGGRCRLVRPGGDACTVKRVGGASRCTVGMAVGVGAYQAPGNGFVGITQSSRVSNQLSGGDNHDCRLSSIRLRGGEVCGHVLTERLEP